MDEEKEIKLIQPPIALMVLPIVAAGMGLYYARKKKNYKWLKSLMIAGGASVIGSVPSWIWAYNINKQYRLQTKENEEE